MTIAIMQPYFFPYIGYWQLINTVDTFVIFDDVNFIKSGYINRNFILINDRAQLFTLELLAVSQNKLINAIEIGNNQSKILKIIERAYNKAPYFSETISLVEDILNQEEKNLAKFIGYSLEKISTYLEIETNFIYSSQIEKDNSLKAQNKILDICRKLNAKDYINTIGGQELYDNNTFQEQDINLKFLKMELMEYRQFRNEFVPNLSIIDVMMFNSIEEIQKLLLQYSLCVKFE